MNSSSTQTFVFDLSFNGAMFYRSASSNIIINKNDLVDVFYFLHINLKINDIFSLNTSSEKAYFKVLSITTEKLKDINNQANFNFDIQRLHGIKTNYEPFLIQNKNLTIKLEQSFEQIYDLSSNKNLVIYDTDTGKHLYHQLEKDSELKTGGLYYDSSTNKIKYSESKTFVIDHPKEKNKYLVHACLEGPEAGVYYRGKSMIQENKTYIDIELPDYASMIANDFTIYVTPILDFLSCDVDVLQRVDMPVFGVSEVVENKFRVFGKPKTKFFWNVIGKRNDIVVEPEKIDVNVKGNGPYKWVH